MHVVTHLLMGWTLAEHTTNSPRDRKLVAWASVAPDLDGLGLLVDGVAALLGGTVQWYDRFHHQLLHGLPGAFFFSVLALLLARRRLRTAGLVIVSCHLHLLGDFLGSRGGTVEAIWPIHYLAPFSNAWTFSWAGQWPLTGWQNTTITLALMIYAMVLAVRRGHSPVELFSERADRAFVAVLKRRLQRKNTA